MQVFTVKGLERTPGKALVRSLEDVSPAILGSGNPTLTPMEQARTVRTLETSAYVLSSPENVPLSRFLVCACFRISGRVLLLSASLSVCLSVCLSACPSVITDATALADNIKPFFFHIRFQTVIIFPFSVVSLAGTIIPVLVLYSLESKRGLRLRSEWYIGDRSFGTRQGKNCP